MRHGGTGAGGGRTAVLPAKFRRGADPAAVTAPTGARVTDVTTLAAR